MLFLSGAVIGGLFHYTDVIHKVLLMVGVVLVVTFVVSRIVAARRGSDRDWPRRWARGRRHRTRRGGHR